MADNRFCDKDFVNTLIGYFNWYPAGDPRLAELEQLAQAQCADPSQGQNGCFVTGSRVRLASGEDVPIEILADLGRAVSVLGHGGGAAVVVAASICGSGPRSVREIMTESGRRVVVTEAHVLPVKIAVGAHTDLAAAREIEPGHSLLTPRGHSAVVAVEDRVETGPTYHLALAGGSRVSDRLFVVEGVFTGDLVLQRLFSANELPFSVAA